MQLEVHRCLRGPGFQLLRNRWTDVCGPSGWAAGDPRELGQLERRTSDTVCLSLLWAQGSAQTEILPGEGAKPKHSHPASCLMASVC